MEAEEISSNQAHFDMLSGIHGMVRDTSLIWKSRHVKGHQDDGAEESLDN